MPANRHDPRPWRDHICAIATLLFGVVLVGFAAPQLAAGFAELPARPVMEELRKGASLDDRYLEIAADSQTASLDWMAEGRGWAALGLLHFIEARHAGLATDDGRARLEQSITADRRAVSLSPGQAYAWTRLAHAELLRHGPNPRVAPLLERAIAQAPYDPGLVFGRLELGFLAWRQIDPARRAMFAEQIRFAAGISAERLAALSRDRYAMLAVREALEETPELRRQVDFHLRRL